MMMLRSCLLLGPVTIETVIPGLWIIPSVFYGRMLPMLVFVSYKVHSSFPCLVTRPSYVSPSYRCLFGSFGAVVNVCIELKGLTFVQTMP
jgi:hypothetical protein